MPDRAVALPPRGQSPDVACHADVFQVVSRHALMWIIDGPVTVMRSRTAKLLELRLKLRRKLDE